MTQALLQIPLGLASDRLGRKRVIIAGLLVFAAGSFIAASAHSLGWLIVGRARQGAGAVCAAVTALVADQTRDEKRAKALAPIGGRACLRCAQGACCCGCWWPGRCGRRQWPSQMRLLTLRPALQLNPRQTQDNRPNSGEKPWHL